MHNFLHDIFVFKVISSFQTTTNDIKLGMTENSTNK